MPRGLDHLVIAVRDLDAARLFWSGLGFTVSPGARNPDGTGSAIIQFADSHIELLALSGPADVAEPQAGRFSLAAFVGSFLMEREGIAGLALKSRDIAADSADLRERGLPVYAAHETDAFPAGSIAFTREPRLKQCAFSLCRHDDHAASPPAAYSAHENGAEGVSSVVLVSRDPADFHEFFAHFTGQHDMKATSLGVTFEIGGGEIELLSPVGFEAWFGEATEADPRRFMACRIKVRDIGQVRGLLEGSGISFAERAAGLIVPSAMAGGVAIAFSQELQTSN